MLKRPFQNARFQRRGQRAGLLPSVPTEQPCQPLLPKSLAPPIDKRIIAIQFVANRGPGITCLQQQQHPRPSSVIGSPAAARCSLVEFDTFRIRKYDRVLHEHNHTTVSTVTDHWWQPSFSYLFSFWLCLSLRESEMKTQFLPLFSKIQ